MTFPPVYILSAVRTPVGRFGGGLASVTAVELGTIAARAALERAGVGGDQVSELIFGHGRQAGCGPNPARQVAHATGLPDAVPAFTVNKACASSTKAITLAAQAIWTEGHDFVLVGGMESMSNTPYFLHRARWGYQLGHGRLEDGMYSDGFMCPLCSMLMGATAENLVERYRIDRHAQDAYAVESQARAAAAISAGRFADEIVPVPVSFRKGDKIVDTDEHPRADTTLEKLARLKPVFKDDGTVHAGNSSGITDGAAALVVASERAVEQSGLTPLARLSAFTTAAVDPAYMGIGPVPALRELYAKSGVGPDQIDLIELNEAFAAQVLSCQKELDLDLNTVNVNGGAIALGHPIGATGARITVTLLHELKRRGGRYGVAALCVSGGMGMALLFERAA
jgi:acetyl-CoA C-acetyltransferase